jgi:hypothetical protein
MCFGAARWILDTFEAPCSTLATAAFPVAVAQLVISGPADTLRVAGAMIVVSLAPAGAAMLLGALGSLLARLT